MQTDVLAFAAGGHARFGTGPLMPRLPLLSDITLPGTKS